VKRFAPEAALVLAAFLFGSTFVLVQDALDDVTPFGYLVIRFVVGALALAPFAVHFVRQESPAVRRMLWRAGVVAGVLLFGGYAFQTVGLQYTASSTSAFITGLYAIFTPIVEAIVRRRLPSGSVCAGIVVATVGLFLLTGAELDLGKGEWLTLACAATFAVWIVYQGAFADRLHPIPFTGVQLAVLAVLAMPPTGVTGFGTLTGAAIFAGVFTGIACSSVALSLQVYGQRRLSPSRAALILLMEPVFAGIIGYWNGEDLGAVKLFGAAVILVGIAIAELAPGRAREDAAAHADLDRSVKG
jgi:drug/metabolite transporter (DMT)-like permease